MWVKRKETPLPFNEGGLEWEGVGVCPANEIVKTTRRYIE
jgi:hypothetical protein